MRPEYPGSLIIETSSACNLKCVMCPQAIDAVNRPMHMDESLVEKLVPFVKNSHSVQLHGIGEPFLSKSFWALLEYLPPPTSRKAWAQGKCVSSVNTNLTILKKEHITKILKSNLSIINVSLDAANEKTYRKIRGYDFKKVIDNLKNLIKARGKREFPKIWANMTLMKENVTEVIDFLDLVIGNLGCDRVRTWIMNDMPLSEKQKYNKNIDGWNFDYEEQGGWNNKKLFRDEIQRAIEYSEKKKWSFAYANKT
jgi:MoaA/NifB/PqqE/SkfB family radical SAM enzyme